MGQTRWKSLDTLKGLACIAVLLIHFNFDGDLGLSVKTFCRFGVPIFLMISGFFFLSNGVMDDAKVVRKIRHIFGILIGSGAFYFVFCIIENNLNRSNWDVKSYIIEEMSAGAIVKLIVTNDPFVYSHLWYLLALIYCYVFSLLLFANNKRLSWIVWLAPVLLVLYSCMQEFGQVLGLRSFIPLPGSDASICLFNLFIFRAFPLFLFGVLARKYQDKLARIPLSIPVAVCICIAGGFLAIWERSQFRESQFYLGTYIMVAAMFIMALKKPESESRILGYIGRELSLYVYILHIAVGKMVTIVAREIGVRDTLYYSYGRAFFTLIGTLLVSHIFVTIKKRVALK